MNQRIAPPDFATPSGRRLPADNRIKLWAELVDQADAAMLLRENHANLDLSCFNGVGFAD